MYDVVIRGGTVVDGTGGSARRADVALADGRVAEIGDLSRSQAAEDIDATDLVVMPGAIDIHTHYDAQIFWDPYLTPSPQHGITTVIGGNCGFSIAPLVEREADYLAAMLSKVEGIPLDALTSAVPWNWRSFGDYLGALEGNIGVNAGFLAGHTPIRRAVLGADDARVATGDEVALMQQLLATSIEEGALGFSSSWSKTHNDATGRAVTSRYADQAEMVALAEVVARYEGTVLEFAPRFFDAEQIELVTQMSIAGQRSINWNLLAITADTWKECQERLAVSDYAADRGGRVVALTLPTPMRMCLNVASGDAFEALPDWGYLFEKPVAERIPLLRDPEVRARLRAGAERPEKSPGLQALTRWGLLLLQQVFSAANAGLQGRTVGEVAAERGQDPFDCFLDIAIEDDLRTVVKTPVRGDDDESWRLRLGAWRDSRTVIGGTDSGAHVDILDSFMVVPWLLGPVVRDRQLLPLEEAVSLVTDAPAQFYGLRDRGRLVEGAHADVMVFDPATIEPGEVNMVTDLPKGCSRLYGEPTGVHHVIVSGTPVVRDGSLTGATPGQVLRSGQDTRTVPLGAVAESR